MMRALYSGVSGLKTHQTKMDVIGNNIANVNTVGFKSSSVTFSDIMYQTTSGASGATATTGGKNAKQIGLGVTTGSTKVSISSAGAAQSTGEAFDIKLTDTNTTNFFIVNNGSQNLFTRAGSFYIDGNGNLAMTSTGYMVMGWQVDPTTGDIRKDNVSALRVMQASNLTSSPEYTTDATVSGVIDRNDTNVTSDGGYIRSLTFYDNLGYSYTARLAIKVKDADALSYTVELSNIYDSNNEDILAKWMEQDPANNTLDKIFGAKTTATRTYDSAKEYSPDPANAKVSCTIGNEVYYMDPTLVTDPNGSGEQGYMFTGTSGAQVFRSLKEVYGVDESSLPQGATLSLNTQGQLEVTYDTTNYDLQFNLEDGTFSYVGSAGSDSVSLNLSLLGDAFSNINMDFSQCLNYDNGGSSTMEMEKGATDGITGTGKKLGTMIGLSVDGTGKIYGSYDNGNTVLLGQIAVAQFANASGLESLGNNCYSTTLNSGEFDGIGVEVSADGSSMASGQLEMSNVDLSTEFTEMITTQRGFQANSRIITTSDTLLEELVNLKR
jgi:flagellar hook protein FlgE